MIEEIKITTEKDDKEYELIYSKTILCPGKVNIINFNLKDGDTPLFFKFVFSNEGDQYTTNYWDREFMEKQFKEIKNKNGKGRIKDRIRGVNIEDIRSEKIDLVYFLNKWDADSYVEISKPINYQKEGKDYRIMIRNQSSENRDQRLFYFSLLKEK